MTDGAIAPVVVGVDGSPASEQAVRLAAAEAVGQGRGLRIVHAFDWNGFRRSVGTSPYEVNEHLLDHAAQEARAAAPDVDAVTAVDEGEPVTVLRRAAASADLLAIGDGGLAAYDCLPTSAVAVRLAAEASCNVLVARDSPGKPGPVVVGVDGTRGAEHALGHAFDIAAHRGADLVVVHVAESDGGPDGKGVARPEFDPRLRDRVAHWQERYPTVPLDLREVAGDPVRVLADEGADAALLVVGAQGDLPTRTLLGAVSMGVLHHAACPVLVIRSPVPGEVPG